MAGKKRRGRRERDGERERVWNSTDTPKKERRARGQCGVTKKKKTRSAKRSRGRREGMAGKLRLTYLFSSDNTWRKGKMV